MIVLSIIIMLSATSGELFSFYSLICPMNAKRRKEFLLFFLPIVLLSGLFFTLQQGCNNLRPEMVYSGFHNPAWHDVSVTFVFFAATMTLLLIARYFVVHFSDLKEFLPRTFNKVRFYVIVMAIFISLSAIPTLGFLPTLSFLLFPGWISSVLFFKKRLLS